MRRLAVVLFLVIVTSGCASTWTPVGEGLRTPEADYKVELPQGWLRFDATISNRMVDPLERGVILTRDGMMLQAIRIGSMKMDETFKHTEKNLSEGMLPQEAAEMVADNYRMAEGVLDFEIIENVPVDVGGHPGFRILLEYKLDNRLWLRRMFYGTIVEDRMYFLHYYAPRRHYFDRDLEVFQGVVDSFRPVIIEAKADGK